MIDQATRDAYSQLLVVRYLRSKGVRVFICNQVTWPAAWERYRPDVVFISWLGGLLPYIRKMKHQAEIVLIDHEGGRLGEIPFKRGFQRFNDDKAELGRHCSLAVIFGPIHKKWLQEIGLLAPEKILVTGSPRLDPYLDKSRSNARRYIGFTLRADAITSDPGKFVENLFVFASRDPRDWISLGYSPSAQQEDRVWHITATLRYMLKIMIEVRKRSDIPIVVRPGPWEQHGLYDFLPQRLKGLTVEPRTPQPEYVRGAFAVVDESSSLGLEALLAGTPVISTHSLIPNLAERIGGSEDAGLFNAPYKKAYYRPFSVEEAATLLIKAANGELSTTPDDQAHQAMMEYLADYHYWPRSRPSSFQIGDAIIDLAKRRILSEPEPVPEPSVERTSYENLKATIFRCVPGSVHGLKALLFLRLLFSKDRQHLRKYHYMSLFYRNKRGVWNLFQSLNSEFD